MRLILKLSRAAALLLPLVWLSTSDGHAQQFVRPIRVLVLNWDEKDYPANVDFERRFQASLRLAARGPVEFYSESVQSSRFPGEVQSKLLHNYIRRKYADRPIDVVVPRTTVPLNFLFKYRRDLFPHTPIVFAATSHPGAAQLKSGAGATGVVFVNSYRKTLDLAVKLHPRTERVFIVSGTPGREKSFEQMARSQLRGYESKAAIIYLTDLTLEELMVRIKHLPERSIVLYVWQQARNGQGKLLESGEVLKRIAPLAQVPMYGMSFANIGLGIVGGYVWTMEGNATKLAEITLKVASGARASTIPVESAPVAPMFDWRQLQRWGIREGRLPKANVILFRELSLWQQFKWQIIGAIAMIAFQSLLICALFLEGRRAQRNASALVRAQRVLRESEERFRSMANTAPVKIVVTDANGHATFFNKTWLDFTGRTIEQELGQGWTAGVHPDDRDECLAKLRASQEARIEYRLEYQLRRADGQYRSLICRGLPRFEPDGIFAGFVESLIDITELKQALANQKLESLGVLASGIAHDFNNLLGSILAGVELLLSDLPGASSARSGLEKIKGIAMRASEIVRQLMVYAGEESTVFEEVDLSGLVREMLQLMMLTITKNAVLRMDVPTNLPRIRGNAAQLRQVVMNLISNASDALPEKGGAITVEVAQVQALNEPLLEQMAETRGEDFLRLAVHDSGCGMSDEIQARIFDPFFSTKRAGRGMGLAAVRSIILSHGGAINIRSAVGTGSRFEILLPCLRQAEQESSEVLISAPFGGGEKITATVLIIEDEDMLRLPIASMLRRKGYSILETGDGATGVDLFRGHCTEIDIVLLDLTLPGMSGGEILRELRKMRPDIKVVLSTAYGRDRAFADVSDPKSVYYLRKPYEIGQLTALLREACLDEAALMRASLR